MGPYNFFNSLFQDEDDEDSLFSIKKQPPVTVTVTSVTPQKVPEITPTSTNSLPSTNKKPAVSLFGESNEDFFSTLIDKKKEVCEISKKFHRYLTVNEIE